MQWRLQNADSAHRYMPPGKTVPTPLPQQRGPNGKLRQAAHMGVGLRTPVEQGQRRLAARTAKKSRDEELQATLAHCAAASMSVMADPARAAHKAAQYVESAKARGSLTNHEHKSRFSSTDWVSRMTSLT